MELLLVLAGCVFAVGCICLGRGLAGHEIRADRTMLAEQRQVLNAEWQALENSRQVNDVFFRARQAMREVERDRQSQAGPWQ